MCLIFSKKAFMCLIGHVLIKNECTPVNSVLASIGSFVRKISFRMALRLINVVYEVEVTAEIRVCTPEDPKSV